MDMSNNQLKNKEYYNLNAYYLNIILENQQISLISYNSNLLDGIKYEKTFNLDEIKKNDKIRNLSVPQLYEVIIKKIDEQKYSVNGDHNCVNLILFKGNSPNSNSDLQIILVKSMQYPKNDYEKVLSKVIINLKAENKIMRNEIEKIKNALSKLNLWNDSEIQFKNSPNNFNEANTEIKFRAKKPNLLNQNPEQNPQTINKENDKDINATHLEPNPEINTNKNEDNSQIKNNIKSKTERPRNSKKISNNPVQNSLTISSLANLEYGLYPPVELSQNAFCKIAGYGANSYNGIVRTYNEDKIKVILDYKLQKTVQGANGNIIHPNISYFGLFDGHGGNKCSNFLQEKFETFLFNSDFFPLYTLQAINESYSKAENEFKNIAFDSKNGKLLDKSGSCSVTTLIIDEWCFVTYLGDSRGLYSFDSGNQLYQITRDHKPNDPIEKNRIEKAGGSVYKDDRVKINGQKVHVREEDLAPGVTFPYRVSPGNLAVNNIII